MNLSQALHEKCLHLDISVSTSDEEEAARLSKVGCNVKSDCLWIVWFDNWIVYGKIDNSYCQ